MDPTAQLVFGELRFEFLLRFRLLAQVLGFIGKHLGKKLEPLPFFPTWANISLRPHRSWSFVEIGNFDRIIWQADQGNSAHDYHPTDYDTERYGCGMSTCQRGDKRRYPDNEAADANTDPNDNFHFKSSSRMG